MKIRYIMDVKIPGEDYRQALELHRALQGAVAEVLMDNGYTTDGLKAVRLDPTAPGEAKEKRESGGSGRHGKSQNL